MVVAPAASLDYRREDGVGNPRLVLQVLRNLRRALMVRPVYRVTIMDDRIEQPFNLELHITNAVALAISAECPIFVEEDVFKKCDEYLETALDEAREATIKKIFDSLDPDSLTKH